MDKFKITKITFDVSLVLSTILLLYSVKYTSAELAFASILLGAVMMAFPIIASRFLCLYYMSRSSGIGQYIIQGSYLLIVLAGLVFYIIAFVHPSDKAAGVEFVLLPVTQVMGMSFAFLLSILLKNSASNT